MIVNSNVFGVETVILSTATSAGKQVERGFFGDSRCSLNLSND